MLVDVLAPFALALVAFAYFRRCATLAARGAAVPGWLGWLGVVVVVGSFATAALRLRAAHAELSSSGASGRGA